MKNLLLQKYISNSNFFIQQTSPSDPDKAVKSLPPGLVVKESSIHGAGLGVWATEEFPARTLFGPYGGDLVLNKENAHKSGYAWQVGIEICFFSRVLVLIIIRGSVFFAIKPPPF